MLPFLRQHFGNPSSSHVYGRRAAAAVAEARSQVAALVGARPAEIAFTGCATEANNLALLGVARALGDAKRHLVVSAVEHPAVMAPAARLQEQGWALTVVGVDQFGRVSPEEVGWALRPDTAMVSAMHANNEVGTIQPIQDIARLTRARGIVLHADAAQSFGKIPVDVDDLDVDLLTLAGHKFYAPKGIGALYVRPGTPLKSVAFGAEQEAGLRPGTENVPAIVGLGAAAMLARLALGEVDARLRQLRDRLHTLLLESIPGLGLNGHPEHRLPNTLRLLPGCQRARAAVRSRKHRGSVGRFRLPFGTRRCQRRAGRHGRGRRACGGCGATLSRSDDHRRRHFACCQWPRSRLGSARRKVKSISVYRITAVRVLCNGAKHENPFHPQRRALRNGAQLQRDAACAPSQDGIRRSEGLSDGRCRCLCQGRTDAGATDTDLAAGPSGPTRSSFSEDDMTRTALVLGAGIGGLVAAETLRKLLPASDRVIAVDRAADHFFPPSLLWLMVGQREPGDFTRSLDRLAARGVDLRRGDVTRIDPRRCAAEIDGQVIAADALIIALGADYAPEAIPGLADAGLNLYTMEGATAIRDALARFNDGRVVVITAAPVYKCPAAPYEAAMLLTPICASGACATRRA